MPDPNQIMQRAAAAFGRGQFDAALRDAESVRAIAPKAPAVLQFIGVVHCAAGRPERGLAFFRDALRQAPADRALRFNAAKAALDSGDAGAAQGYAAPLKGSDDGDRLLAAIAAAAGDSAAAAKAWGDLARRFPRDHEVLNNYGNALNQAGRGEEAVEVLQQALRQVPGSPQVLLNLGRAETGLGHYEAARGAFLEAAAAPEADAALRYEIGQSLLRHGEYEAAIGQLGDAARQGRRDGAVFVAIGVCFFAIENREQAERAFRTALSVEPSSERAALNLAMLFERENKVDDLRALFDSARRNVTPGSDLDFIEALVLRRDGQFAEALAMAERSASESVDATTRAQFIGQVADRLNDHAKAFEAFAAMNREAMHSPDAARFDPSGYPRQVERNTELITPAWFASWRSAPVADPRPSPAFLGGFLRSGTTLLDTIVMGHAGTVVREEEPMLARLEDAAGSIAALPNLDGTDVQRMRDAYFAEALERGPLDPGKLLIDKYPLMTLRASFIHRAFPDAKFIFALRHPCDVVLSCWMQNFRSTQAMAAFLTLENAARLYAAAMAHWERCREVMPLAVHTVRYEDMVEDLEGQLRPLVAFLGLEWDDKLLDHQSTAKERGYIRTPSYAQVTEGIYRRSSGRWENYREQMAPVLDTLAPWAIRFGYGDPRET